MSYLKIFGDAVVAWNFFFATTGKLEIQAISVIFSTENKM